VLAKKETERILADLFRTTANRRDLLKRAAALGLAAPAFAALAGSAPRAAAQDAQLEGELTFWHGLGTEATILNEQIIPAWEAKYPNATIEVLQVPFDQLQNKYNTEASAGGGPDVLLGPSDWIGQYVEAEVIMPLDELMDEATRAIYNPAAIENVTFDGQIYQVPQNINGVALVYNKALAPTAPTSTAELLEMAGTFATANPGKYGFGLVSNFYSNAGYLFGVGGQIFGEGDASAFNTPETVEFLTLLKTMKDSPGVFTQADQGAIESLFKEGKAAMMFNGPWFLQAARDAIGAENVGVALLPAISTKGDAQPKPFVGSTGLYLNPNSEDNAELAFEFARWFSADATQMLVDEAGQLPANTQVTVPAGDAAAQAFAQQYQTATALPTNPKMSNVWEPAGNMITKVLDNNVPPEQAAEEAAQTIDAAGS
jgi:arabinogalactan oligomer/maltooligosaccharide transport system substrate-binding protein